MTASACRSALSVDGALATAVSGCFASIGRPQFAPQSAYSCISSAPIYCTSTTASCDPFATPSPVIANGGFESGSAIGPWVPSITSTPGNVVIDVSNERPYSGSNSFKVVFNNNDGGIVRLTQSSVKLEPGQTYEMSYRWFSTNNVAYAGTSMQVSFPGRETLTFQAPTSFANVILSWSANRGPSAVTAYLDEVAIVKIS
ncbi:hypothetical protein B0T21DRAFT_361264 [Apiosordaria backusii]|uniref:CBM-cenC domain-containing protein n=1 Tax=Apiosordaria backusii TaxID=314023 RepID=A0AA40EN68_9PEZI|nr:hypothetical protein B0T21DRAFT_361264 [Apiosordaria backusii]